MGWSHVVSGEAVTATELLTEVHQCTIIHSLMDYMVQCLLGVLAFATLLAKWWLEQPGAGCCGCGTKKELPVVAGLRSVDVQRRPFTVFALDSLKQGCGFLFAHIGNMATAVLLQNDQVSPCVWYFVNVVFDCTVRVLFAYALLRIVQFVIRAWQLDPRNMLDCGEYGGVHACTCWLMRRYSLQLCMWLSIVLVTVLMKGLVIWGLAGPLGDLGTWVMGPLEDHTRENGHHLELFVVMMAVPFVLCAFQLWVQDSFLRSKTRGSGLHRFDASTVAGGGGGRGLSHGGVPEPIFSIADALWGPDSHRPGSPARREAPWVPEPDPAFEMGCLASDETVV